jgi:ATP-binding cassette subfamily C (CFTR/MRP) protein 4
MVLDDSTEEKITEEKAAQEEQQQQQCDDVQQTDDHHRHNDDRRRPHHDATLYPPNMMSNASWFSRLIFYWPYPLLKKGLNGPLSANMLPEILQADTSNYNRDYFEKLWETEKNRCQNNNAQQGQKNQSSKNQKRQQQHLLKPSLHRAMLIDFFTSIWYVQPLMLAAAIAKIVQAVFLGYLIESFENPSGNNGYIFAGAIVICGLVILFEHHHVFFITWRKGMQLRVSCVATIYQKSLKLSSTHQETNASTGRIMNLASNDVERFLLAALFISHLIWSPIQSFAILVVGCTQIGPAFAIGFILLIFGFVPFQFYLSNRFAFLRSKIADITDQRVNFVSQAVQGSRVMKMSGYEYRFLDRIMLWRLKEVTQIAKANRLKAINEAMFFSCNIVVSLTIFLLHVFAFGGILTPYV